MEERGPPSGNQGRPKFAKILLICKKMARFAFNHFASVTIPLCPAANGRTRQEAGVAESGASRILSLLPMSSAQWSSAQ
jgi:hypothetical protein